MLASDREHGTYSRLQVGVTKGYTPASILGFARAG